LHFAANKCKELVGEEDSSQTGKFTLGQCFDMGSGTLTCSAKEAVKLYVNSIQTTQVERVRSLAMERTMSYALSRGASSKDAAKQAAKAGKNAAKMASRHINRITGPILSSSWDFFETLYFGGSAIEGFLRASGTLYGTYASGFYGEYRLGRVGYLLGSQVGSWIGGRIGVMVYDVLNGFHFLLWSFKVKTGVREDYESRSEL